MNRLIIVSNRLPVTIVIKDGVLETKASTGGLATGLRGPHERSQGLWIGWPGGTVEGMTADQRAEMERQLEAVRAVPIHLTQGEIDGYYTGFANGVLWPLFHYLIDRIPYAQADWEMYQGVSRRFAEAVCARYRSGDLVWVQDYQLALVPRMVRERIPGARIGFFLHIPFPAAEVFRLLPWREPVLRGILGADVVGFHTFSYVRQFINTLTQTLGLLPAADRVQLDGREVKLWAYPMGIDAGDFDRLAREPTMQAEVDRIRRENGEVRLLLGVDRLDYTKGIPRRLLAIERLLERQERLRGRFRFVQIAVPSRMEVPQYETFAGEVQQLVGRINGRYSTATSAPIHFLHQGFSQAELVALYRAADVMLVTPLRDGMNLVAKEFAASRCDEDGVLVLSEFAGAASEMGEAVLVNPYDIDRTAEAITQALEMPAHERRTRMRALRDRVFTNDVHRWAEEFLGDLESHRGGAAPATGEPQYEPLLRELLESSQTASRVLWLLDYDGTLVPLVGRPELAAPDEEIRRILGTLASKPGMQVHVISGRQREVLQEWLGDLPIGLHAEHGLWSRLQNGSWEAAVDIEARWKEKVRSILREFMVRTPGALIEEKTASLAWHYRMADLEYGERQARELKIHLAHALSNLPVEVLSGKKVVEVRPHGVNKGMVVTRLLAAADNPLVIAMGDDETDEQLFKALPEDALSVCVGAGPSAARYLLPDVGWVRRLLRKYIAATS